MSEAGARTDLLWLETCGINYGRYAFVNELDGPFMAPLLGAEHFGNLSALLESTAHDFEDEYWRLRPPEYWQNLPEGGPGSEGNEETGWRIGALLWLNPDGSIGYPDEMRFFMGALRSNERYEDLLKGLDWARFEVRAERAQNAESEAEA